MIPSFTAASPMTSVSTIVTAVPVARGIRMPDSLISRKIVSLISASSNTGKGMLSQAAVSLIRRMVGVIS